MAFEHTFSYLKSTQEGIKNVTETRNLSASKAIRFHCMDCSGGNVAVVRECHLVKCPLWPFRMGKSRPHSKKNATAPLPDVFDDAN
jgi:hypothetical protein